MSRKRQVRCVNCGHWYYSNVHHDCPQQHTDWSAVDNANREAATGGIGRALREAAAKSGKLPTEELEGEESEELPSEDDSEY